jgi:hypothetical protein
VLVKETLAKISNGLTYQGTQVTLERYARSWLDGKVLSRRSHTVLQYRQIVNQHILPQMGRLRIVEIQPAHLKQLYMTKRDSSSRSVTIALNFEGFFFFTPKLKRASPSEGSLHGQCQAGVPESGMQYKALMISAGCIRHPARHRRPCREAPDLCIRLVPSTLSRVLRGSDFPEEKTKGKIGEVRDTCMTFSLALVKNKSALS